MAAPEAATQVELSAIAGLLASYMSEELVVLVREIFQRKASDPAALLVKQRGVRLRPATSGRIPGPGSPPGTPFES